MIPISQRRTLRLRVTELLSPAPALTPLLPPKPLSWPLIDFLPTWADCCPEGQGRTEGALGFCSVYFSDFFFFV